MSSRSLDQTQTPLLSQLQECAQRDYAPFHTPGHKRGQGASARLQSLLGTEVLRADLPELPELDNLFAPSSVIQQAQELAAAAFGADQTWFLANGSTCGVEAAILATCQPGDKILLPRNVHQSAIAGLILSGAVPVYLLPGYDAMTDLLYTVTPEQVAAALQQHPDAKAVLLVSPTYHGVCADIAAIAQIVHKVGIPLLVDEAHGAHFGFHPDLPTSALSAGADLAVQSTHKTLAGLTQAAMLHLKGDHIPPERIQQALQLVQSTSPSYLLLASLDAARHQMAMEGKVLLEQTLELATWARSQLANLPHLSLLSEAEVGKPGFFALDSTRLTVDVRHTGQDGFALDERLHTQYGVTAELPALHHLTFILSLGDRPSSVQRLVQGFQAMLKMLPPASPASLPSQLFLQPWQAPLTPRQAFFAKTEQVAIADAVERISGELVCPYPPGIPVLMPGEVVSEVAIAHLQTVLAAGGSLTGCADPTLQSLKVVCR
ncbi:MAG TPA: aminotransferase class I/II-fold pyridoxal phosphate-dependent enzyme [Leptolyngbyaceae cyanobacterium M33_DOE_097]|uniref:Aminotransferase class I/II-fold pyridoxal phosphate-dependent enzyme n=1 Tax=Oscillatoriales cyanobacterium SpSt-418 TaxID=2282169 RepID=A0A7C3KH18_9CYAN|nr:aminotransferase class I/II-fold pyridoxal phosphate-dependent enzyme [Leptolyngbyaceae cyanobacterium M33_DOE_097]